MQAHAPSRFDAEHLVPRRRVGEHVAARADDGVVHQYRHRAVALRHRPRQLGHCPAIRGIGRQRGRTADRSGGLLERVTAAVDEDDLHTRVSEGACRCRPNAAGGAGPDSELARRERGDRRGAHWSMLAIDACG